MEAQRQQLCKKKSNPNILATTQGESSVETGKDGIQSRAASKNTGMQQSRASSQQQPGQIIQIQNIYIYIIFFSLHYVLQKWNSKFFKSAIVKMNGQRLQMLIS